MIFYTIFEREPEPTEITFMFQVFSPPRTGCFDDFSQIVSPDKTIRKTDPLPLSHVFFWIINFQYLKLFFRSIHQYFKA